MNTTPLMLYHGTTAARLDMIREQGLVPRRKTKAKSNWKHTVDSNPDAIYLSNCYGWHFAHNASDDADKGLILEIDTVPLPPVFMCPDEDALEQGTRESGPEVNASLCPTSWDMKKRTRYYRKIARFNPDMARASLDAMGTCAYYGIIPWTCVTRYAVIDWHKVDTPLLWQIVDSSVSVLSYRFLKDRHAALTRWIFNDPVTAGDFTGYAGLEAKTAEALQKLSEGVDVANTNQTLKLMAEHNRAVATAIANRAGIQVFDAQGEILTGQAA